MLRVIEKTEHNPRLRMARKDGGEIALSISPGSCALTIRDNDGLDVDGIITPLDRCENTDYLRVFSEQRDNDETVDIVVGDQLSMKTLVGLQVHCDERNDYGVLVKARTTRSEFGNPVFVPRERLDSGTITMQPHSAVTL